LSAFEFHFSRPGHLASRAVAVVLTSLGAWSLAGLEASAQTFDVELSTTYLEPSTFVDVFSERPMARVTGAFDLGDGGYVEAYASSGFDRPFRDEGSEFGLEVGGEWALSAETNLNVAAGRWMNYAGQGLEAGDWFGRIGLSQGGLQVSASLLAGDSDTVALNAAYEWALSDRITLAPTVGYLTADETLNFGLVGTVWVTDHWGLAVTAVAPDSDTGERETFVSASLLFHWGPD